MTASIIGIMAKTIIVVLDGESAVFTYKPIDRGALYGKRRRVPFDANGNECTKASLLNDGSIIIKSGMTAQGYGRAVFELLRPGFDLFQRFLY